MNIRNIGLGALAVAVAAVTPFASASALSLQECSAKYKAAKDAKTLNGQSWNDFQRLQCTEDKPAAAATKPVEKPVPKAAEVKPAAPAAATPKAAAAAAPAAKALTAKECSAKYKADKAANALGGLKWNDYRKAKCGIEPAAVSAPTAPSATVGSTVFPTTVGTKYATEKPGKARLHTCLDQYRANKATGGNGGLTWISRKGGGYYSECNKRLKGKV